MIVQDGCTATLTHSHTYFNSAPGKTKTDNEIVLFAERDEAFTSSNSVHLFNELEISTLYILRRGNLLLVWTGRHTFGSRKSMERTGELGNSFINSFIHSFI